MSKRILFYAAVALQVALLLGMIGRKTYTMAYGQRIMLKCAPIDPRSLFRGDYVTLGYEISTPDRKSVKGLKSFYEGQPVCVTLRKSGAFWGVTGIYSSPPSLAGDEALIKGRASRHGTITYGIESYFVPEGEGRPIEIRRGDLAAEIALDRFGHPVLLQIFLDGRAVP